MENETALTLVNLQNGNLAFKLLNFEDGSYFDHLQRNNYYSLIWVTEGDGQLKADFSDYEFDKSSLFAFAPYQPFMFTARKLKGIAINFHPDFFCIYKHQSEAPCLFNNIYQPPYTFIDDSLSATLYNIVEQMRGEMRNAKIDQHEVLASYLKVFLIAVSRSKMGQLPEKFEFTSDLKEPFILQNLKDSIERDFKQKHSASDYAKTLNISTKALAKITKSHFNRTLTELISERIIIEAKRELYMTQKPVKEIAYELGYDDEYYFSRFFKTNVDISPQIYRDTVGFGRSRN
jgi:YesN/AraC family two-component response regulator